ncbi:MAG: hypothetical protein HC853_11220 [Anaerolineae bacterium]|nr:hypothetical protein [Anaerolineae bacterium]
MGIANASLPDAFRWAREVLRLSIQTFPQAFPVYQGQVVHRQDIWYHGTYGAAEQCWDSLGDSEHGLSNVIRQAAAVDTWFSWRNFSPGINNAPPNRIPPKAAFSVDQHSGNRYVQTYYLQNEPDSYYPIANLPNTTEACTFNPNVRLKARKTRLIR